MHRDYLQCTCAVLGQSPSLGGAARPAAENIQENVSRCLTSPSSQMAHSALRFFVSHNLLYAIQAHPTSIRQTPAGLGAIMPHTVFNVPTALLCAFLNTCWCVHNNWQRHHTRLHNQSKPPIGCCQQVLSPLSRIQVRTQLPLVR
jgi:hypothetical protein